MTKPNNSLSFKKIKKIYHEEVKQEPVVKEVIEQLEVLPELAPIIEEKQPLPEPKVEVVEGTENLVNEFLLAIGAQGLVEVVSAPPQPKVKAIASAFVDPSKLDDFLKNIQEEVPSPAPTIVEQTPTLVTPVTKEVVDLTKPIASSNKPKIDLNLKAINDRLGLFEKRLGDLAMRPGQDPGGGETKLRFLDDIDRTTIGDGKYLNYNDTTKKFQFTTLSSGMSQIQSDWTQTDNTALDYINNKPTALSEFTNDIDYISWTNLAPTPSGNFKTIIDADDGIATITLLEGLPGMGSSTTWSFDKDKVTFPDSTEQTTAAVPQIQSDWNQANNTALDYIKNKPSIVTDITSVDNTVQISANIDGTHDLSVAASLSTSIDKVFAYVTNADSVTIHKGDPVFLYRATGNRPSVILAKNTSDAYSAKTLGLASQDIAAGNPGWVQTQGVLTGVDTHTYAEGDTLYLGATAGTLTNVKPYSPNHLVYMGVVVRANQGSGQIYIKPQNGYELEELHNVNIDHHTALADGHYLTWSDADSQWINSAFPTSLALTSLSSTGTITSNHATAFVAGDSAISGVALQMPREGAIRNLYNGSTNMYFDVSTGGTTHGQFQFRSSSSFTNVLTMSSTSVAFNTGATVTSRTPNIGKLAWNSAIDSELTIDDYRFRVTNNGGIYPQIISNISGQTKNSAWTAVAAISGQAIGQGGSTGTLVPNNAWTSLYTFAAMNSAGDTVTVTLQDKSAGRIYRITFMRSDNGSTTGYNIIGERLL